MTGAEDAQDAADATSRAIGERLRRVRLQQGLALQDVEVGSGGDLKASVVGAYERGERSVSIVRLRALADFYGVPVTELLPEAESLEPAGPEAIVLDLVALTRVEADHPALARYVRTIQARRGDYNRHVLTVRRTDLDALAAVLGMAPSALRGHLDGQGLLQ